MNTRAKTPKKKQSLAKITARKQLSDPDVATLFGFAPSISGATVDSDSAMSLSAVFAGVNLYSRIIASLPLNVYRREGNRKEVANNLKAQKLLHYQPNAEMTAATFRRTIEFHRLIGGNAYAEIEWADNGHPWALWPIEPWRVKPRRDDDTGVLYYQIDQNSRLEVEDILHVPLVSQDGVTGRSFIDYAVESLGLGISSQEFAAAFFGNGARPGGILKHAGTPDATKRREFRDSWTRDHGGSAKANKVAVMWGGWEFQDVGGSFSPQDAQLLDTRKFLTEEVARWLGLPPTFLQDLSRATFSNIEELNQHLIDYSIGPVLIDYEQEFDRKLLFPPGTFCKHNLGGLLRGNSQARATMYKEMFLIGGRTINEILELEDENPIGPNGDVRFVPANMITLEKAVAQPAIEPTQAPVPGTIPDDAGKVPAPDIGPALRLLIGDTLCRLLVKESKAIQRAAQSPNTFLGWMDEFYGSYGDLIAETIAPALRVALAGNCPRLIAAGVGARFVSDSKRDLLELTGKTTAKNFGDEIKNLMFLWERKRPSEEAERILEECKRWLQS